MDEQKETPFIHSNIGLPPRQSDEEGAITPTSATVHAADDESPRVSDSGKFLIDWYSDTDPANPQNWSGLKKGFVLFQLCAYTMAVYMASSVYVPGEQEVSEEFKVGPTPAALGLAMYVLGYGIGPLLFAPLSEIPAVGRNWVYVPTFFVFVILSIPTALVKNFAGLLVLRFITGFLGSPCLANGGASVGDIYSPLQIPIYLSSWTAVWFWGPAIGPVVAGFAIQAKGWRWGLWEVVWLTAPLIVFTFFALPETSPDTILHYRAVRLRKLTGRSDLQTKSDILHEKLSVSRIFWDALVKPTEIMIKDPAVLFTNIYVSIKAVDLVIDMTEPMRYTNIVNLQTSLTYGIYYSFFECFPLVYPKIYGFNLGETSLCFLTIGIACVFGIIIFFTYQFCYLLPDIKKNGLRVPEHRLVPALFAVVTLSAGYFMFGFTVRKDIHWIVNLIAVTILITSNFLIFQSVFVYLPMSYPKYAASLFAANDLCRSLFAVACILFARPMFLNIGIAGGVSILAGLSCLGIFGMFCLWKYGAWLRSKSTFAQS